MKRLSFYLICLFSLFVSVDSTVAQTKSSLEYKEFLPMADSLQALLSPLAKVGGRIKVEDIKLHNGKRMDIHFSNQLADYPIRDTQLSQIYSIIKTTLPKEYSGYLVRAFSSKTPIEELSSPYFSGRTIHQKGTRSKKSDKWVSNISLPYSISNGLQDSHIALWQSHGFYYEQSLMRWEWQRARIFQTVEDLYTQSYVLPFLVPMLENAGAFVALPRERDSQIYEVIVDNDPASKVRYHGSYSERGEIWKDADIQGFADKQDSYEFAENPFKMGTARVIAQSQKETSVASWSPDIPHDGEYAVYVSYLTLPKSTENALYSVYHNGGKTEFVVNQRMGGSTWVYLGTFNFSAHSKLSAQQWQGVTLSNMSPNGEKVPNGVVVTADAVKIGGGMGNIARKPANEPFKMESEVSGYPRFTEGSRYWLQWAGFADSTYSANNNKNDYNDDYMSRSRWVNDLYHNYNVPLDLSFAFHTDAGTTLDNSIIGTLSIYTRLSNNSDTFSNGEKRIINRELADLVQTQICDDIKTLYEPQWIRRGLWDRSYYESRVPDVPSMLLELLSHQNFADMRYGLDPNFRFSVSRAVYKGILRFQSERMGFDYVVQPLPVKSFSAELTDDNKGVTLSWKPAEDPLEPTAVPEQYVVYTRVNELNNTSVAGFDNGIVVTEGTSVTLPIDAGKIYSYKVCALNRGGVSFPSEILSVGVQKSSKKCKTVLIMNGFDRLSAPASYASKDTTRAGFENHLDGGVQYIRDFSFIGAMHEYRRSVPWMDDDAPGFGASYANYEDKVSAANTFDYPFIHGISIMKAGYNFVSTSRAALTSEMIKKYPVVDMIMGKQVKTQIGRDGATSPQFEVFPIELQNSIKEYCSAGGRLLISGAYVATDIWDRIYNEPKSEKKSSDRIKELIRTIKGTSNELGIIINDLNSQAANIALENTSLGFNYFTSDTTLLSSVNMGINTNSEALNEVNKSLKELSESIVQLENESDPDYKSKEFAMNVLKYRWMTHYASTDGVVKPVQNPFHIGYNSSFSSNYTFNTKPNTYRYAVESPDALVPVGDNAWTIFRYAENNISAGVAYKGDDYRCVTLGFPIETLSSQEQIDSIIEDILIFLTK